MFLIKYIWYHYFLRPKGWYKRAKRRWIERRVNYFSVYVFDTIFEVELIRKKNKPYHNIVFNLKGKENSRLIQTLRLLDVEASFWMGRREALRCLQMGVPDVRFFYQADRDIVKFGKWEGN